MSFEDTDLSTNTPVPQIGNLASDAVHAKLFERRNVHLIYGANSRGSDTQRALRVSVPHVAAVLALFLWLVLQIVVVELLDGVEVRRLNALSLGRRRVGIKGVGSVQRAARVRRNGITFVFVNSIAVALAILISIGIKGVGSVQRAARVRRNGITFVFVNCQASQYPWLGSWRHRGWRHRGWRHKAEGNTSCGNGGGHVVESCLVV